MENDLNTDLLILQSHLESMLDLAKLNSNTLRRFQTFEMRLLNLNNLTEIIDHLLDDAKEYFDIDLVTLCLIDHKGEIVKLLTDSGYEYTSKKGLMLLDNKQKTLSCLSLASSSFIGVNKNAKYDIFFDDFADKPASVAISRLIRRGSYLGTLNLGSYQADRFGSHMATDFVEHLASIVGVCLENILNFETIKRASFIDNLTRVNNRHFFEQRIGEELDRCQRSSDPISCLFLDIDFFKSINDKYGHQAGDKVLLKVANIIKTQLRNNDVLARFGGEEFVVLLTNINETKALEIAERIRNAVQLLKVKIGTEAISVSVSIGSSTYQPVPNSFPVQQNIASTLINLADSAMYQAKKMGRNRVENGGVISEDPKKEN